MKHCLCISACCLAASLLFACRQKPKSVSLQASNASQIDSLIKAAEKRGHAVLADTTKNNTHGKNLSPYFFITRFYYDSVNKELFKAEKTTQASKTSFVAFYEGGRVVKTTAQTEFGRYDYYFPAAGEGNTTREKEHKVSIRRSLFQQQCWQQARALQAVFQHKVD